MKIYISEDRFNEKNKLQDFEITTNYNESDNILIVPGGLSSLSDMIQGILDNKDVYIYNRNLYYASVLDQFFKFYELGIEKKSPFEYMKIETDLNKIIEELEEKENGKTNDGKIGKLL